MRWQKEEGPTKKPGEVAKRSDSFTGGVSPQEGGERMEGKKRMDSSLMQVGSTGREE